MTQEQRRVYQVEITLSASDQIVLSRYLADINSIISADNAALKSVGSSASMELWTESQALAALTESALERERKFQMLKDGHPETSNPEWITTLVRDVNASIRAGL